ncbi:MAG: radical SAM protein [Nanoarchaeota archaeon]|nr:radical SAM protein [Nanoarchaeota archaeon]
MLTIPFPELIEKAQRIYTENFPLTTLFERAIFFSWGCTIGDCTFCYMSTQPADKPPKETKRSVESILAEFIIAKNLGWEIGFFTGGIGVLKPDELEFLLKAAVEITGEKIWLSVGAVPRPLLLRYLPYIKGVVGSTETINPELHRIVCPSKPLAPYERMFEVAKELHLQRAMTFIVGMGETKDDFVLLEKFIRKYGISKIHIYGLIPTKGTMFEHSLPPTSEEQAWWIAQLRIAFPTLDIQCGIWEDRAEYLPLLLRAGANSISKFQAIKLFGGAQAHEIEAQVAKAGRHFLGTLTHLPGIDWMKEVEKLSCDDILKEKIKVKLQEYVGRMQKKTI